MKSLGVRTLRFDFGVFTVEEFDGHSLWEAGDPIPDSNETLVMFLKREGFNREFDV